MRFGGFPHEHFAVAIGGGQEHIVGAEPNRGYPIGVLLDLINEFAARSRKNAHHFARPTQRDQALIGANVGRQNDIVFVANFGNALAGCNIPQHHAAAFRFVPAAGQQNLSIAAEAQHMHSPLGKRQHADQLQRVGVVKQNFFLPRHGDQRRPRAGGKRRHCPGALGVHHRLKRQARRHGWRPVGLLIQRRRELQLRVIFLCRLRFASRTLERPVFDESLNDRQLIIGQFRRVQRHVRL